MMVPCCTVTAITNSEAFVVAAEHPLVVVGREPLFFLWSSLEGIPITSEGLYTRFFLKKTHQ